MSVEQMYQEIILDHYKAKHHSGLRDPYEAEVTHVNPSCGDEILLRVHLEGDTVADVSYDAVGCSISQASTSVMTDLVIGKSVAEGLELAAVFQAMMHSQGRFEPDEDQLEDAVAFLGVAQFPARVKCALLGWSAWKDAVAQALAATPVELVETPPTPVEPSTPVEPPTPVELVETPPTPVELVETAPTPVELVETAPTPVELVETPTKEDR